MSPYAASLILSAVGVIITVMARAMPDGGLEALVLSAFACGVGFSAVLVGLMEYLSCREGSR